MANLVQLQYFLIIFPLLFVHAIRATPAGPPARLPSVKPCVASPDWVVSSHLNPSHCIEALELFRRAEILKDGSQRLEFFAPGGHPASRLLARTTPRKYSFSSCTIGIAMFASVPPWLLPPTIERRRFAPTDVASFDELYEAARQIVTTCVQYRGRKPLAGWQEMGRLGRAIGVFVWESGSPIDRIFRPWNGPLLHGIGNETAAM